MLPVLLAGLRERGFVPDRVRPGEVDFVKEHYDEPTGRVLELRIKTERGVAVAVELKASLKLEPLEELAPLAPDVLQEPMRDALSFIRQCHAQSALYVACTCGRRTTRYWISEGLPQCHECHRRSTP
jgi:hypothetical protein